MSILVNPIKNDQIYNRQFTEKEIQMVHQHMNVTNIRKM